MGTWWTRLHLLLLLFVCGVHVTEGYKPVIIVHGLFDGPRQFLNLARFITKVHPGTNVSVIDLYDDLASLRPMWRQIAGFKRAIHPILKNSPQGVHFLCFSQGGLICRALLYTIPDHNVHTFISLSSPQAGQYGETSYLRRFMPDYFTKTVYRFCYSSFGQKLSICDYWNDPHHRDLYLRANTFLAPLNGEKYHLQMKAWKENFLRIKKLVLIGGPDDGVITPWQSSHFGFFDSNENIVEMQDQDYYIKDLFGLKTLADRGDLLICVYPGVEHTTWHSNMKVFNGCIEKWLV